MKKQKWILSLGTVAVIASPIAAVVSCGSSSTDADKIKTKALNDAFYKDQGLFALNKDLDASKPMYRLASPYLSATLHDWTYDATDAHIVKVGGKLETLDGKFLNSVEFNVSDNKITLTGMDGKKIAIDTTSVENLAHSLAKLYDGAPASELRMDATKGYTKNNIKDFWKNTWTYIVDTFNVR